MTKLIYIFLIISLLYPVISAADASQDFPLNPRLTTSGLFGTDILGEADGMVPLWGSPNGFFYIDAQTKYDEHGAWLGSFGSGIRKILQNCRIWGGYLFIDRNVSEKNKIFWDISPGIESLGETWDFRLNAYFPVNEKRQYVGDLFADDVGDYSYVEFSGHQQYDHLYKLYDAVGNGGDFEIGRTIPRIDQLRVYAGGYFFTFKNEKNMRGILGHAEYFINRYFMLTADDTYDNYNKNTATIGVRFTLGGNGRMLDLVERHLATLNSGTGLPIVQSHSDEGRFLERDGIYFFGGGGSSGFDPGAQNDQCSYEHPCTSNEFDQITIDAISKLTANANFYLTQSIYDFGTQIILRKGQSIYGRNQDYIEPANDNDRPLLIGSLRLRGNNNLEDFNLSGNGTEQNIGILINGVDNIYLSDVSVSGFTGANGANNFSNVDAAGKNAIGIDINNAENIVLNAVEISHIRGGDGGQGAKGGDAFGIQITKAQHITMMQDNIDEIIGGNGGNGQNGNAGQKGGNGGKANGLQITNNSSDINFIESYVGEIKGGNGGMGGIGSTGNGGKGGDGGESYGMNIADANQIKINQVSIEKIDAGNAGNGNSGNKVGGNGGKGGNAYGICTENTSQFTLGTYSMQEISGGLGGNGGSGNIRPGNAGSDGMGFDVVH